MDQLVIAPTATYKRGPLRKEIDDTIKDYAGALRPEQKVTSIILPGSNKATKGVEQKLYQDPRPMNDLHQRNRDRDLEVYYRDLLYETRPLYNVSYPEMKLRRHTT